MKSIPLSQTSNLPDYHDYRVSKRNDLITTGRFDLSLNEQKILLILTSTIQPSDETFTRQSFRAVELARLLNITPQAMYQELPKLTRKLLKCYIEVEYDGVLIQANLISGARYERGCGRVTLSLSEDLKPFYLHLKNKFTTYELKYILRLNSKYSIRFYEFFQCYESQGGFVTSIEELLTLMVLKQKSYQRYADFNRKVLKPAIAEINELTDLSVTYQEIKEGRKVVRLLFKVKKKRTSRKKKSLLETLSDEQKVALETLIQEIVIRTNQTISLDDAYLIQSTASKQTIEETDYLSILRPTTQNPVGAILDYFKSPEKYQHLQKKQSAPSPSTLNSIPLLLPEASNYRTDEEKIAYMKSLQQGLLDL